MQDGQWASSAGLKRAHSIKLRRALDEWAVQVGWWVKKPHPYEVLG